MASRRITRSTKCIFDSAVVKPRAPCRTFARTLATIETPGSTLPRAHADSTATQPILHDRISTLSPQATDTEPSNPLHYMPPSNPFIKPIVCATYAFPSIEPQNYVSYPSTHLAIPVRRDILHRAVTFEADAVKDGTAWAPWRSDVKGSGRKLRPQKGTGSARLGDKSSPMLHTGGKAHGPKPRDMSTDLPKKMYDLAFRIALSHRYRLGELMVLQGNAELDMEVGSAARYLRDLFIHNSMNDGLSLLVTFERRDVLFEALDDTHYKRYAKAMMVTDLDVKNLLMYKRVIFERDALEWLMQSHEDDVIPRERVGPWAQAIGQTLCIEQPSQALAKAHKR